MSLLGPKIILHKAFGLILAFMSAFMRNLIRSFEGRTGSLQCSSRGHVGSVSYRGFASCYTLEGLLFGGSQDLGLKIGG